MTTKNNTQTAAASEVVTASAAAVKVIATAATEALALINQRNADTTKDHDLIIQLDTKLDALKEDIKNLTDGSAKQIGDHETRIRTLEERTTRILTWGGALMLLLGIAQFLVGKFL